MACDTIVTRCFSQSNGLQSEADAASSVLVSYRRCQPGHFEDGLDCQKCSGSPSSG
jgi:hypothetical protein